MTLYQVLINGYGYKEPLTEAQMQWAVRSLEGKPYEVEVIPLWELRVIKGGRED